MEATEVFQEAVVQERKQAVRRTEWAGVAEVEAPVRVQQAVLVVLVVEVLFVLFLGKEFL